MENLESINLILSSDRLLFEVWPSSEKLKNSAPGRNWWQIWKCLLDQILTLAVCLRSNFNAHGTDYSTLMTTSLSLYFIIPKSPCPPHPDPLPCLRRSGFAQAGTRGEERRKDHPINKSPTSATL